MQWRKNRVAIGAVAFLALLGGTIWAVGTRDDVPMEAAAAIPTLEIDKEAVTSLEITRPNEGGTELVILSKVGDDWRVTSPLEADADPNNVQSALNRLAQLSPSGLVATRPENYTRLEVDDAQAVKVVVHVGEAPPIQLRIGKYSNGVTMVRIEDRTEVFSVDGSVRFPFDRDLSAWRNRRVTEIQTGDVQEVEFDSDRGTFRFSRQDDSWVPAEKQKPIRNFDPKKVEGLVSTAARLTASGFAPSEVSSARAGFNEPEATITLHVASTAEDANGETEGASAQPRVVALQIGGQTDKDSEFYLRRSDDQTIYVVSKYLSDRLRPDAESFEKPVDEPPPPSPSARPGMQGMPQGQQPQLPPEVMQQLQEQIRQQQQQPR